MSTLTYEAAIVMSALDSYKHAVNCLFEEKEFASIQSFTSFKVNGLWVVTITYK